MAGFLSLISTSSWAVPKIVIGQVSGEAGSEVAVPITFDAGKASVACIEFNITLPEGVEKVSAVAGPILNSAEKTMGERLTGRTWRFAIFGINQTTIGSGTLMTLRLKIESRSAGTIKLPIDGVLYTTPSASSVKGISTSGSIKVN